MEAKRPFAQADWLATPEPVRHYIEQLEQSVNQLFKQVGELEKRAEKLETQVNKDSQNSSKPPSSDSPFKKPKKKSKKGKRKKGAQKGHKGHRQQLLEPTKVEPLMPEACDCGHCDIDPKSLEPFYTHQHIELPEIKMGVTHYVLHQGQCRHCGKIIKAKVPKTCQNGYGPRLSALIAELSGSHGASRETVQSLCQSVLNIAISIGGIQRIIDRASEALEPVYDEIGRQARSARVNYIDETSWFQSGKLKWLWTMVNTVVAFFMIHPHRSKEALLELIDDWKGILVSDNYGVYRKWVNRRQSCLAHYIRQAKGLSERKDESIQQFGKSVLSELRLLCHWAKAPPGDKQWTDFYSRLIMLLFLYENADDDAGKLARLLLQEMDSLWVFLEENGIEPTNNRAERALRFGVLWRKRSKGTQSNKGDRWVERILSVKQTCRMRSIPLFPVLVNTIDAYFKELPPDFRWLGYNY